MNKVAVTGVTEGSPRSFRHVSGVSAHVLYEGGFLNGYERRAFSPQSWLA